MNVFSEILRRLFWGKSPAEELLEEEKQSKKYFEVLSQKRKDLQKTLLEKHDLLILSEDEALKFSPKDPKNTVLIRISDPGGNFPPINEDFYKEIICRQFFDLESSAEESVIESSYAYKKIAAACPDLFSFIEEHLEKTMVVHCHAGIARSGAIALFIADIRGDVGAVKLIQEAPPEIFCPNRLVLKALRSELKKSTNLT